MKKIKNFFTQMAIRYYLYMMSVCFDNHTYARVMHGEESKENRRWVKRFEYYSKKYELLIK